eukprot:Gregarina_sp_Pseudo_9__5493@NODE_706_length_2330_cov_16_312964_g667_i0_p1_GENE_NODE_706_length_2330_cov_16_312964_g667_i0NODE_706_length_2330_cov_16_312964_g667_i0_p1_ORF_typecomplete_len343_score2_70GATA/PF00320_27/0_013GATA/PF00320_27/0_0055_NODE_706_length_2330_cov_16_312964_g667_i02831311
MTSPAFTLPTLASSGEVECPFSWDTNLSSISTPLALNPRRSESPPGGSLDAGNYLDSSASSADASPKNQSPRSSVSAASTDTGGFTSLSRSIEPCSQTDKLFIPNAIKSELGEYSLSLEDQVVDGYPVPSNSLILSSVLPSSAFPVQLPGSNSRFLGTPGNAAFLSHQLNPYLHTLGHVGKRIGRPRIDRTNTKCQRCGTRKTPQWRYLLSPSPNTTPSSEMPTVNGVLPPNMIPSNSPLGHPAGKICLCNACWLRAHKERQRLRSTTASNQNSQTLSPRRLLNQAPFPFHRVPFPPSAITQGSPYDFTQSFAAPSASSSHLQASSSIQYPTSFKPLSSFTC